MVQPEFDPAALEFGTELRQFGKELKGCKLLDKDRFRWAAQAEAPPERWWSWPDLPQAALITTRQTVG